jgi:hypothetical protein
MSPGWEQNTPNRKALDSRHPFYEILEILKERMFMAML